MTTPTHTLANAGAPKGAQQTQGSIVVNGEAITPEAIGLEAQNHTAPRNKPGKAWNHAARAMAVRVLLLQAARRNGLKPEPAEVGPGRFETEDEALIRALLEETITVQRPLEEEVHAVWTGDPERFRSPPLWEVSHILVACDMGNPETRVAGFKRAVALAKSVQEKPRQFARFAMDHSDCDSKANGGALGQLSPGDSVPEFEAALRTLGEGDITPKPVPTRHGFHIIRMDALALGQVLPYDAVRGKIADAMEKTAWASAARQLVNTLVQDATIEGLQLKFADV
ncbi:MAG: peptidylprolyl isomerase [Hyphomicrobiales bacterium]|jgi:peptidyl-prolyl cis-trans isomerase C